MPEAHEQPIVLERRGCARWIRLNRPHALNAISPDMLDALAGALDAIEADRQARVVVLTGTGRAFCAGADLKAARGRTEADDPAAATEANVAFVTALGHLQARLERSPLPVIGALNGIAVAGGLELLLCCDFTLAAASARIGDAHANYGLIPGGGGSVRLPKRIGAGFAKYLMFTGDMLPADAFLGTDLVLRVVPDDRLEAEVDALAATLSGKSPIGLSRMKRLIDDGLETPHEVALRREMDVYGAHAGSDDRREGLAAFGERRPPRFTGR